MIKEYWNLIGWEQFLSISWELDFFQACSFRRMLMNHKIFHFTQISDKTNDVIFLKSPKTMILGHFWTFLFNGDFFQKKLAVTHNMGLSHHANFQKKLMRQSQENLCTDGRTDGRRDRQILFYATLPAEAGSLTTSLQKWLVGMHQTLF